MNGWCERVMGLHVEGMRADFWWCHWCGLEVPLITELGAVRLRQ